MSTSATERSPIVPASPPLSSRSPTQNKPASTAPVTLGSILSQSFKDPLAFLAQIGLAVFLVTIAKILHDNPAALFTYHPSFQTAAIISFTEGILLLQPTTSLPAKTKGLLLHQVFQFAGLPLIFTGSFFIIYNKIIHGAKHIQSWHGLLGVITLSLILIQIIFGAFVVYAPLQRVLGGTDKAKGLWKIHRVSGYLVLVLLYLTPFTAISSTWIVEHSSSFQRIALGGGLVASAVGTLGRLRFSKLGLRR